jgi:hypothetical protein
MHHYISCTTTEEDINAEKIARLLINHVWKLHEFSSTIISNRDSQFVSFIWKFVCKILKIDVKLFTAFHFETNNQSEVVNQKMKRYLRNYCNYQQDDWFEWLSMTEFAFNVAISVSTELFVFMTNYEFESRMSFDSLDADNIDRLSVRERILILTQKTKTITEKMKDIWDFIKKKLTNAQNTQKRYANRKRTLAFKYQSEDMIWLSTKNIKIERSFRKLNHKWIKSFKIKKLSRDACQLKLSSSMKIHDTFHIALLRFAATDSLIDQIQSSSPSIVVNDEEKYEMNDILNNRYHYDKLQHRIS